MTENNSEDTAVEALLQYLKQTRGFDFTGYKRASLKRRIRKQMQSRNLDSFNDYLDYLQVHPEEYLPLFNTILINVTAFFRDRKAWNYLESEILPRILNEKSKNLPLRIWSAGCASGEEAYTLAMILAKNLGVEKFRERVKIYATDIDEEALNSARHANYSSKDLLPVPEEMREQYFEPIGEERYVFRPDLRRVVIFGRHDLVQDAPISRLDLLVCRNTLMYFNSETQAKVLDRFHFALNPDGFLFLGKAEMLLTHSNIFTPISLQYRIFTPVLTRNRRERLLNLSKINNEEETANSIEHYVRLRELAFDRTSVAQIIVDFRGNLVLANIQARGMFDLNILDRGRPLQDLEISYRPLELRSHIEEVNKERHPKLVKDVVRNLRDNKTQYLDVHFQPLMETEGELLGVSISFIDVTRYHDLLEKLQHSNQELETANEELETTNEELQSTNEELQSTNEELQSSNEELETTNEELQSTNEELETMNEELQSTNEELQTINDELRLRTSDLNQANAFLNSILTSLRAGVVVVDLKFHILSWNDEAENLWGLRSEEVKGQSLLSLDIGLPVERLREPIRRCIAKAGDREETLLEAINRRGKTIQCRISYNPLIGHEKERQGVILLMEEVN